jgi:hypothetical protein
MNWYQPRVHEFPQTSGALKLATSRLLDHSTASCSLEPVLKLETVDEEDLYKALDWLLEQQERIEKSLAKRHLNDGMLVLYDATSTEFEGPVRLQSGRQGAQAGPAWCSSVI